MITHGHYAMTYTMKGNIFQLVDMPLLSFTIKKSVELKDGRSIIIVVSFRTKEEGLFILFDGVATEREASSIEMQSICRIF